MIPLATVTIPKFYLVWSPLRGELTRKHETFDIAWKEAQRLYTKHPEYEFYILESKIRVNGSICVVNTECEE